MKHHQKDLNCSCAFLPPYQPDKLKESYVNKSLVLIMDMLIMNVSNTLHNYPSAMATEMKPTVQSQELEIDIVLTIDTRYVGGGEVCNSPYESYDSPLCPYS